MVTLITDQLRRQSLDEPCYRRALSLNVSLPEVGSSPKMSWTGYGLTPESGWSKPQHLQDPTSDPLPPPIPGRDPFYWPPLPSLSVAALCLQSSPPLAPQSYPPPPPPKRHCRSLSVPEDLSRCRTPWRPSASRIWTPVKRRCHSGGGASVLGGRAGSAPLRGPSSSVTSSSVTSSSVTSSSPTFFSLALSSDSPLPWAFPLDPWDPWDGLRGGCASFFPTPSSSSSPAPPGSSSRPLLQRRFSLSPMHIHLPPQASPAPPPLTPHCPGPGRDPHAPWPSSACSTPASSRRKPHPALPRCHSQPCDMKKPRLKRRHDSDTLPCSRPGLDFSKMTQIASGGGPSLGVMPAQGDLKAAFFPAESLGRTSIGPVSESEEEEDEEEDKGCVGVAEEGVQNVFERDCTELDLELIEEN
ncbi:protein FAM53C-like [Osmerus mordax]|uniref:protein FAM53C-like n=1 Tax=Osmerus mordax TaxID=8014 RepID=UPI00350F1848